MTLSNVGTANSQNSTTITVPSGGSAPQLGDLIVFAEIKIGPGPPTMVLPTGFTSIGSLSSELGLTDAGAILAGKISDGTEGGTTISGLAANIGQLKLLSIFRDSGGRISAFTTNDLETTITVSDPAAQTINASSQTTPLIALALFGSDVHTRSFSPAQDGEVHNTAFWSGYLYWKMYDSSPADITADMSDGGSNVLFTTYLKLTVTPATTAYTKDCDTATYTYTAGASVRTIDSFTIGTAAYAYTPGTTNKAVSRATGTGAYTYTAGAVTRAISLVTATAAYLLAQKVTGRRMTTFYPTAVQPEVRDTVTLVRTRASAPAVANLRAEAAKLNVNRAGEPGLSIGRKVN